MYVPNKTFRAAQETQQPKIETAPNGEKTPEKEGFSPRKFAVLVSAPPPSCAARAARAAVPHAPHAARVQCVTRPFGDKS